MTKTKSKSFEIGDIVVITGNIIEGKLDKYHHFSIGSIGEIVDINTAKIIVRGIVDGSAWRVDDMVLTQEIESEHLEKLGSVL